MSVVTEAKPVPALDEASLRDALELDRDAFEATMRTLHWPKRWFGSRLVGAQHLPQGGALLISNHGPMGLDAPFLMSLIHEHTGRAARGLVDRIWMKSEVGRSMAKRVGCLLADRQIALAALESGDLVLNYPGGVAESMRGPRDRYTLKWDGRYGFIKVALWAGVPIVPVACIGMDDMVFQFIDHDRMTQTSWGKYVGANYGEQYVPPLLMGPVMSELSYWVGEPIHLDHPPEAADDIDVVRSCQQQVKSALEDRIACGLADREARPDAWRERVRQGATEVLGKLRSRLSDIIDS